MLVRHATYGTYASLKDMRLRPASVMVLDLRNKSAPEDSSEGLNDALEDP